tara:strand:+ start:676 stop:4467 length:3792 start_codon:yes stop_codon:yes gene_type:complete
MAQVMSAKDILAMEEKETFSPQSAKDILAMGELEEAPSAPLPTINKDEKLKVNDIVANDAYVDKIRDYMVDRKGKQFLTMEKDELVDKFIGHMRYFNTNEMFTIDEARYVATADNDKKAVAGEAYKIYDRLGNVFVNDGLGGAVTGVADYIGAVLTSPSTYLGLGVGKALTLGAGKLSAQGIKTAAKKAGREALERESKKLGSGQGKLSSFRGVAKKAEDDFIRKATRDRSLRNVKITGAADAAVAGGQDYMFQTDIMMETGAQEEYNPFQTGISVLGAGVGTGLSIWAVPNLTGAAERGLSSDVSQKIIKANNVKRSEIESVEALEKLNKKYIRRLKDKAKRLAIKDTSKFKSTEEYKKAIDKKYRKLKADNAEKLKEVDKELKPILRQIRNLEEPWSTQKGRAKKVKTLTPKKKAELQSLRVQAAKLKTQHRRLVRGGIELTDDQARHRRMKPGVDYRGFPTLVAKGKEIDEPLLGADVLNFIFGKADDSPFGDDIVSMAEEAGAKFKPNMNNAQKYAKAFQYLSPDTLKEMSALTKDKFGVYLGDVLDIHNFATQLGHRVARTAHEAGKDLGVFRRAQNELDIALVGATEKFLEGSHGVARKLDPEEEFAKKDYKGRFGRKALAQSGKLEYAQNVWKRLLVSAPQTTAANVFGWGQYYLANSVAEVFQGATYAAFGDFKKARALFHLQGTKMKNLLDPYSTLDSYEAMLKTDDELSRFLKETISGGIERASKRYGFAEKSKFLGKAEQVTNFAQTLSAVNLQDSLTKSQMFMTSLDKYLRLLKGKTFKDALESGSLIDVDHEVMDRAMSDTLRSVFAEDYTQSKSLFGFAGKIGKVVETASNAPGIGFVLPFGRFMNNVAATAYQWNPVTGGMEGAVALMRQARGQGRSIDTVEAFSKATVGYAAINYAMSFQDQHQERGYAWNELDTGTGEVTDITNVFPLSLLMIAGRVFNKQSKGETVDRDLAAEFGKQIAIGQAATDLQFGNDITALISLAINQDQDFRGPLPKVLEGLGHVGGNVIAGATRPLDTFNKVAGYAFGELSPYDVTPTIDRRMAKGFGEKLGYQSTKYVDNIIEGVMSIVNQETTLLGDKAKVAYREGDLKDPSPYRTLTGQKIKQPRTFANIVFNMVDKPEWKTGMYSNIPEYDNFANKVLAPLIEKESELLLKDESFIKGDGDTKKNKVNDMLRKVKARVNKYLTATPDSNEGLNYRKKKITGVDKSILKRAREITKIKGVDIRDLTNEEVSRLEDAIKYIRFTRK